MHKITCITIYTCDQVENLADGDIKMKIPGLKIGGAFY